MAIYNKSPRELCLSRLPRYQYIPLFRLPQPRWQQLNGNTDTCSGISLPSTISSIRFLGFRVKISLMFGRTTFAFSTPYLPVERPVVGMRQHVMSITSRHLI